MDAKPHMVTLEHQAARHVCARVLKLRRIPCGMSDGNDAWGLVAWGCSVGLAVAGGAHEEPNRSGEHAQHACKQNVGHGQVGIRPNIGARASGHRSCFERTCPACMSADAGQGSGSGTRIGDLQQHLKTRWRTCSARLLVEGRCACCSSDTRRRGRRPRKSTLAAEPARSPRQRIRPPDHLRVQMDWLCASVPHAAYVRQTMIQRRKMFWRCVW